MDNPYSSDNPIKPKKKMIIMIALLIGLVIPAAIINLIDLLTNTVQSKKEIEKKTGLSVFGEIGVKPEEDKGEILDVNSRSFVSEQVRMIRSNLAYLFEGDAEKKEGGRTIMITSSAPGEGKSFVTSNIAASLGLLDKRVVILGLDLRKPIIHTYLGVSNKKGVSNYLIGRANEEEIVQGTAYQNVFLIPSGPMPPNPSELLTKHKLSELIEVLRQTFDYILLDTPPTTLVTDALIMAPLADVCFYVVRFNKSPKNLLDKLKESK